MNDEGCGLLSSGCDCFKCAAIRMAAGHRRAAHIRPPFRDGCVDCLADLMRSAEAWQEAEAAAGGNPRRVARLYLEGSRRRIREELRSGRPA